MPLTLDERLRVQFSIERTCTGSWLFGHPVYWFLRGRESSCTDILCYVFEELTRYFKFYSQYDALMS